MTGPDVGRQSILLSLAVLAALVGITGFINPSLGVRLFGGGAVLNGIGVVAFLLGGRAVWRRVQVGRVETKLPDAGRRATASLAGEQLDRALADRDARLRDHLRLATIDVLRRNAGSDGDSLSEAEIQDRLETGDWTDNQDAAAFFDYSRDGTDGLIPRIRERLRSSPTPVRRARAVVSELGSISGVTWPQEETAKKPEAWDRIYDRLKPGESSTRQTGRYVGSEALPLLAVALGIFGRTPTLLLVGATMATLLGAVRAAPDPPTELAVEHRLAASRARHGETVKVTVAVTNEAERSVHDIRLVDEVPAGLSVDRGRPTMATALSPGETATTTYSVEATFGEHEFGRVAGIVRDAAGATETLLRFSDGEILTCLPSLTESTTPAPPETTPYSGQVETRSGGAGVEFFGLREYQRGDALTRVDWKRLARTGVLTTVQYREERAASVVLLIDARPTAYVAPTRSSRHAVTRSISGAATLVGGLLHDGDRVGLTALSATPCWVPPGAGTIQRARLRTTLGTHPAFGPVAPNDSCEAASTLTRIRARLSPGMTVVFFTPLIDDWPASVIRRLRADGVSVTVVSPDPTGGATLGTRLSRIQRAERISELRSSHMPVIDWARGDSLALALTRRNRR